MDAWRLAVGTLTAIPVRPPGRVDRGTARRAMLLAPLAALPLGLLVTAIAIVGDQLHLPPLVVALLAVASVAVGTRCLHWDGLSDTVDGLTASYDAERSLAVMRTGTSGPAGVVAVVLVLGLQVVAAAPLLTTTRGAVLAGLLVCLSRCALALTCLHGVPGARADGLGSTYTGTVPRPAALLVALAAAALAAPVGSWAGLDWWRGPVSVVVATVVVAVLVHRTVRRFGGVTGDVFGASIEVSLAVLLIATA